MKEDIYASSVCFGEEAVLIRGKSGFGKSDLALRLINEGAVLISDDRTIVESIEDEIFISPNPLIRGMLEVRGLGIKLFPFREKIKLKIVIDLLENNDEKRSPGIQKALVIGKEFPLLELYPFNMSTVIKVKLAMKESL